MKRFDIAVIGLGNRGSSIIERVLLNEERVRIVAVCDEYENFLKTKTY